MPRNGRPGVSNDKLIRDIESDSFAPGLSEDVVRALSLKKGEPEWMMQWRLAAYRQKVAKQKKRKTPGSARSAGRKHRRLSTLRGLRAWPGVSSTRANSRNRVNA